MQHALIMLAAAAFAAAGQEPSPDPSFLETIRVVDVNPEEGTITVRDREGEIQQLREGDLLDEPHGARLDQVSRTTLVLTRVVRGGDGQEGEALIVVRFDASGKPKVREYRTVPDASVRSRQP